MIFGVFMDKNHGVIFVLSGVFLHENRKKQPLGGNGCHR